MTGAWIITSVAWSFEVAANSTAFSLMICKVMGDNAVLKIWPCRNTLCAASSFNVVSIGVVFWMTASAVTVI